MVVSLVGHLRMGRVGWRPCWGSAPWLLVFIRGKKLVSAMVNCHTSWMALAMILWILDWFKYYSLPTSFQMSIISTGHLAGGRVAVESSD